LSISCLLLGSIPTLHSCFSLFCEPRSISGSGLDGSEWKTTSKKIRNGRRPQKKEGRRPPKNKKGRRTQKKI
jgi:hypothetical protein